MLVKVALSFEPMPCTTAMIATEMPAAMRPYSMAVAPDSSFTKRVTRFFMFNSIGGLLGRPCIMHPNGALLAPGLISSKKDQVLMGLTMVVNNAFIEVLAG